MRPEFCQFVFNFKKLKIGPNLPAQTFPGQSSEQLHTWKSPWVVLVGSCISIWVPLRRLLRSSSNLWTLLHLPYGRAGFMRGFLSGNCRQPGALPCFLKRSSGVIEGDAGILPDKRDFNNFASLWHMSELRVWGQDRTRQAYLLWPSLSWIPLLLPLCQTFCGRSPISIVSSFSNHPQCPTTKKDWTTGCVAFWQQLTRAGMLAYVVWGLSVSQSQHRRGYAVYVVNFMRQWNT